MYLDKDTILNSLTKEDVTKIVTHLGSEEPRKDRDGNLIFQTICHNAPHANNSYKLYYYHEPFKQYKGRTFHCYTGCSESFNIVELVIRAHRANNITMTWYKALKYIAQVTGKMYSLSATEIEEKEARINDFEWMNRLKSAKRKQRSIPSLSEINENILEIFYYAPHEDWLNDHITREALSRYEIGYYGLTNQITIPHRDKDGRLIGIRGRFLNSEDIEKIGKYVPLQINGQFLNHQLGSNLYGMHVTQERIKQIKKVMIVEAEKSCLQAYSYFGDDSFVVAVCGSNITPTQIKMILHCLQVNEVIIAFDRDYHEADSFEAEIWWNKILKKVAPLVPYVKVCICADSKNRLDYQDSPTDKGKEILLELLDEKIVVTMEDIKELNKKD